MNQLTIRGFGPDLERRIRELAEREGLSLNQAAIRLLQMGAGLTRDESTARDTRIGSTLDRFFGTWSDEDARAFAEATRDFERIDDSMWQ